MCGIFCQLCCKRGVQRENNHLLKRGPDGNSAVILDVDQVEIVLRGYLLHIRGDTPCLQPVSDGRGNLLLFCGELYDVLGVFEIVKSDTELLLKLLSECGARETLKSKPFVIQMRALMP